MSIELWRQIRSLRSPIQQQMVKNPAAWHGGVIEKKNCTHTERSHIYNIIWQLQLLLKKTQLLVNYKSLSAPKKPESFKGDTRGSRLRKCFDHQWHIIWQKQRKARWWCDQATRDEESKDFSKHHPLGIKWHNESYLLFGIMKTPVLTVNIYL